MFRMQKPFWLAVLLMLGVAAGPQAIAQQAPDAEANESVSRGQFSDGIAAIVNKKVITLKQVDQQAARMRTQLSAQKIEVPDKETLRRQVLQRMITDELINQEAESRNITVSDAQVKQAVETIAQRNRLSPKQLRAEVEKSGATWDDYLDSLRDEIRIDRLRQLAVDSYIIISDAEVDAFLRQRGSRASPSIAGAGAPPSAMGEVLGLAQILVAVPEGARASEVESLRRKAQDLLQRLRGGDDFASVAAASSDGPEALDGGDMGQRPVDGWPDLFIDAVAGLGAGQVSDIIQSGNGFHILKVVTRSSPQAPQQAEAQPDQPGHPGFGDDALPPMPDGPMLVQQTHVQHILIKTDQAVSEERALERLRQLQRRISMGESFSDLAKRFSEDSSAPQGGDLGWVNPGETVPPFESAMDALQPGQVSEPVLSTYGWHLIKVLDRREKDIEDEYRRMQARQALFQRRAELAFEDWLSQLRGQAYIDNRLEPKAGGAASDRRLLR
ncbi:MAG TPA: peptidylprolyl isomerase [Burkholderiaceae bacterium]|nr:peptidylprolyl isomerase [Burkholderiaceae bacterium]